MQLAELSDHNMALRVEAGQFRLALQSTTQAVAERDQQLMRLQTMAPHATLDSTLETAAAKPQHWVDSSLASSTGTRPPLRGAKPWDLAAADGSDAQIADLSGTLAQPGPDRARDMAQPLEGKAVARLRAALSASEAQRVRADEAHAREVKALQGEIHDLCAALEQQQQRPHTGPMTPDKRSVPPRRNSATSSRSDIGPGNPFHANLGNAMLQPPEWTVGHFMNWAALGDAAHHPPRTDDPKRIRTHYNASFSLVDLEATGLAELAKGLQEQCSSLEAQCTSQQCAVTSLQAETDRLRSELQLASAHVSAREAEVHNWQRHCSALQQELMAAHMQLLRLGVKLPSQHLTGRPASASSQHEAQWEQTDSAVQPSQSHSDEGALAASQSGDALGRHDNGQSSCIVQHGCNAHHGASSHKQSLAEVGQASEQSITTKDGQQQHQLAVMLQDGSRSGELSCGTSSSGFADGDMDSLLRSLEDAVCGGSPSRQLPRLQSPHEALALHSERQDVPKLPANDEPHELRQNLQQQLAAGQDELGALRRDIAAVLERRGELQRECESLAADADAARARLQKIKAQVCMIVS